MVFFANKIEEIEWHHLYPTPSKVKNKKCFFWKNTKTRLICSQALWWEKYRSHTKLTGVCLRDQDSFQRRLQVFHSEPQQWAQQAACWTSWADTPNASDGPSRVSNSRPRLMAECCCLVPHCSPCFLLGKAKCDPGSCRKEGSAGTAGSPAASSSTLPPCPGAVTEAHAAATNPPQDAVNKSASELKSWVFTCRLLKAAEKSVSWSISHITGVSFGNSCPQKNPTPEHQGSG